jgi:hypothetical protein
MSLGGGIKLSAEDGIWVARNDKGELIEAQPPAAAPGVNNEPLSKLHGLFLSDFPNLFKTQSETALRGRDENGEIEYMMNSVLYRDFTNKTYSIGLYMPSTPLTHQICVFLVLEHKKIVDDLIKIMPEITSHNVATEECVTDTDLIFDEKVVIYHETDLSAEEITDLKTLYRNSGVSVEFRGTGYVIARWGCRAN